MEKRIKNNGNIVRIVTEQGYCTNNVHITKAFFKDNELDKTITFSIWDDMSFNTHIHNEELCLDITELSFEIDIEDKIYYALNRMLGRSNSLIIDDDDTREELRNYLEFKRTNNKIIITFHDEDIEKPLFERFNIFIKNIGPDYRSKIDDFNIKYRLVRFFREAEEILTNEFHQYSLDEYFELLKQQGIYEGENPFLHKTNRYYKNPSECCLNCLTPCDRNDKTIENWCEKYIPNREEYYTHLLKSKNKDEHCSNCEYSLSPEVIDAIIDENSEYRAIPYDEAVKKIGHCELYKTIDIPRKLDYWCPSYLKKEEQGPVKKLIPNNKK